MKTLSSGFDKMKLNTNAAFDRTQKNLGLEYDPGVQVYKTLTPEDLSTLTQKFGEEPVMQFIIDMEKELTRRKLEG